MMSDSTSKVASYHETKVRIHNMSIFMSNCCHIH